MVDTGTKVPADPRVDRSAHASLPQEACLAISRDGEVVSWTTRAAELFDRQAQEVMGRSYRDLFEGRQAVAELRDLLDRALDQGEATGTVHACLDEGAVSTLTATALAVPHPPRHPEAVVLQLRDRSKMRQLRRVLATAEQQQALLSAAESLGLGFAMTVEDPSMGARIVYANEAAQELLGRTRNELLGTSAYQAIAPEERARLADLGKAGEQQPEEPTFIETVVMLPDGTRVPVEVGLGRCTYQGHRATLAMFRELTNDASVQRALDHVRDLLRDAESIVRQADDASQMADELVANLEGQLPLIEALVDGGSAGSDVDALAQQCLDALAAARALQPMNERLSGQRAGLQGVPGKSFNEAVEAAMGRAMGATDAQEHDTTHGAMRTRIGQVQRDLEATEGAGPPVPPLLLEQAIYEVLEALQPPSDQQGTLLVKTTTSSLELQLRITMEHAGPGATGTGQAPPAIDDRGLEVARGIIEGRGGRMEILGEGDGCTVVDLRLPRGGH